jgi:arylsulfatase A-like enzyme
MISRTAVLNEPGTIGASTPDVAMNRLGFLSLLLLSAWCGLVAGLLEVGTIVLRKQTVDPNRLYGLSRHFLWLIPVTNLCVFLALGLFGCIVCLAWPRRGRALVVRLLCAATFLPALFVAAPLVYNLAWVVAALGAAAQVVPILQRHARGFRRFVALSFPVVLGTVLILGGLLWAGDWSKQARAGRRPLPPPGSSNVLLIVLDTVAADHLSLYGYDRSTSPALAEIAERGIRFDAASSASSWTLPSHATMFTGRWMHELSVGWLTPLDEARPTLAEFLGARGYATAGFIANTQYCASDSGLGRGFTHYQDYSFPELTAARTAVLVDRGLMGIHGLAYFLADWLELARLHTYLPRLWRLLLNDRKGAAVVNREFLGWLSRRVQPERPFFAFLNYLDAHYPYHLTPGRLHRFGVEPSDIRHEALIRYWWDLDKSLLQPEDVAFAAAAYDDCIADLDEYLGSLFDELSERGVLERTWLFIVSDHGESFGEHAGVFCHGSSLYETELHVPLLIVPPGGRAAKQVVTETVSLRDLPATIVDVLGLETGSPFPGASLGRFWNGAQPAGPQKPASADPALAEVLPSDRTTLDDYGMPKKSWPLGALNDGEWSYIRRAGDVREELFRLSADAKQERNLAGDPAAGPTLERMRAALNRLTAGPLVPDRFSR